MKTSQNIRFLFFNQFRMIFGRFRENRIFIFLEHFFEDLQKLLKCKFSGTNRPQNHVFLVETMHFSIREIDFRYTGTQFMTFLIFLFLFWVIFWPGKQSVLNGPPRAPSQKGLRPGNKNTKNQKVNKNRKINKSVKIFQNHRNSTFSYGKL